MINTQTVPARNLQKSYKAIIEGVKAKKHAVILTTNNLPQAAIISLEDLTKLQQTKARQASLDILELALKSQEELKSLPANLRQKADEIIYSK